ncbi:hypothetical protein BKA82DRAFT_4367587 [Pisolithus tinctorius]|nr:hypothetical protein BKA82DRAFT_4367587 [Pisolithus tinctorius]
MSDSIPVQLSMADDSNASNTPLEDVLSTILSCDTPPSSPSMVDQLKENTLAVYMVTPNLASHAEFFFGRISGNVMVLKGDTDNVTELVLSGIFKINHQGFFMGPKGGYSLKNAFSHDFADTKLTCNLLAVQCDVESTVTDTSSNKPEQPDRGFASGILSNLFTQSLATLSTPIPPVPSPAPFAIPPQPQNMMSGSLSKGTTAVTGVKPTELKIGAPTDFDGDQKNAMSWLYSVQTYLLVNEELYDTDTKKVVYALSYMKKGVAHSWAATYQKIALEKTHPSFGTFTVFVKKF